MNQSWRPGKERAITNSRMVIKFTHLLATLRAFGILRTCVVELRGQQQRRSLKTLSRPLCVVITRPPLRRSRYTIHAGSWESCYLSKWDSLDESTRNLFLGRGLLMGRREGSFEKPEEFKLPESSNFLIFPTSYHVYLFMLALL